MKQRLNIRKSQLATAIALAGISVTSAAQTAATQSTDNHQAIEMIQVIGQATGGLDQLLSLEDIEKLQANNLSDLFKIDATISAGGPVGLGQKIYLRNMGEDSLNISVDGAEVASGVFHHSGRVLIEPELLKQVEIEAGTGSATAGPGALGGAIRFTTKDPDDLLLGSQNVGAFLKSTYYTNGEGLKNSISLYGRDEGGVFSGLVSVIQSDQNDLEDANGDNLAGTEADRNLAYVKLVADLSEEQYLSLSYEKLEEEGDILYRPEWIAGPRNALSPTEATRDTVTFNYGFNSASNDLIDVSLNIYQTQSEQIRDKATIGKVETIGATLQNTSEFDKHKLIVGTNYRDDTAELNYPYFSPAYPGDYDEEGEVKGLFIQDIFEVSDALTVSAGLRFDDYELRDRLGQTFDDSGVSTNISANYKFTDSLHLSAGYAEALQGIEIVDAYKMDSYQNASDLGPQEAKTYEIGMDYYTSNLHIAFGAYKTKIEDPFNYLVPGSNLEDDIVTDGFYLSADYQYEKLSVKASYHNADTEVDGEIATRYEYGSNANSIGDTLALTLDYAINDNLQVGWISEFVKGIHGIDIEAWGEEISADKPGYGTHDIYLKWTGLEHDRLAVSLTIKNVLDKQYLSHASTADWTENAGYDMIRGHYEPGRDVYVSASLKF